MTAETVRLTLPSPDPETTWWADVVNPEHHRWGLDRELARVTEKYPNKADAAGDLLALVVVAWNVPAFGSAEPAPIPSAPGFDIDDMPGVAISAIMSIWGDRVAKHVRTALPNSSAPLGAS